MQVIRMSRRGQIVIPQRLRRRLQWREGDVLGVRLEGERLILRRIAVDEVSGPAVAPRPGPPLARSAGANEPEDELSPEEQRLLDTLDVPLDLDGVQLQSGLPIQEVLSALTFLEVKGLVRRSVNGRYMRVGPA